MTSPFDLTVRHDHAIARYRTGRGNAASTMWRDVADRVEGIAQAPRRDPALIQQDVRDAIRRQLEDWRQSLGQDLREMARNEARWLGTALQRELALPDLRTLQVGQIPILGRPLDAWWRALARDTAQKVGDLVKGARATGMPPDELAAQVAAVLDRAKNAAKSLTTTAVQAVANQARVAVARENPDQIRGILWSAILDARTTPICRALNGRVFAPDRLPTYPAHFGERSSLVPIGRGDVTPIVPSYDQWLQDQDTATQDEALGPTRARLWREGRITAEDLATRTGRPLTLAELASRQH